MKRCHERGLIYRGYDAMPWCPRCSVGLSQMEMAEGYQLVAHRAVFVRFPLRGCAGENLLAWTTTPWTLTSNVAAAVNPELTYLKVSHKDQIYYLAKGAFTARRLEEQFKRKEWVKDVPKLKTLEQIFKEKGGYEVVGELKGSEMVGWAYDGPFDELPAQATDGYPAEMRRCGSWRAFVVEESYPNPAYGVTQRLQSGTMHIPPARAVTVVASALRYCVERRWRDRGHGNRPHCAGLR